MPHRLNVPTPESDKVASISGNNLDIEKGTPESVASPPLVKKDSKNSKEPEPPKKKSIPKPSSNIPLYVFLGALAFIWTILPGIVVGCITLLNAQTSINNLSDQLRSAIFDKANIVTRKTVDETLQALKIISTNFNAIQLSNQAKTAVTLNNPQLIWDYYNVGLKFPTLFSLGIVCSNWATISNGRTQESSLTVFNTNQSIQLVDPTTSFTTQNRAVLGINGSNTLFYGPTVIGSQRTNSYTAPNAAGYPGWKTPVYMSSLKTFVIPLTLQTWQNQAIGSAGLGNADTAYIATLSLSSLTNFYMGMNISMNGVVVLVDGNTGTMLASSYPNVTYNSAAGAAYTAMGNPHKLISESVTFLANTFGSFQTVQSIPRSPEPIITSYNNGQDVILINAVWISDLSSGLNWFLVLAIPSSDLSTVVKDGMKGAIISVVVLSVFAIGIAALFAWLIMTPIKKITNGMQEATLLDFSRMREGYLQERNFVYEIGTLQYIFHKLLYEVVDIVRKNEMMEAAIKEKGLGTTHQSTHSITRNSSTAAPSTAPHVLRLSRGVTPSNGKLDIKD